MSESQSPQGQSPTARPGEKARLSEQEKKRNHIQSEQKRREAIRDGFDRIADIVPGMAGMGRSEATVMDATVKYMTGLIMERQRIIAEAQAQGIDTTTWHLPKKTIESCEQIMKEREMEEREAKG